MAGSKQVWFLRFLSVAPNREQHIRAASCKSRLETRWETPNFETPWRQHYSGGGRVGSSWKFVRLITLGPDEVDKVSNLQPFGGRLCDGGEI